MKTVRMIDDVPFRTEEKGIIHISTTFSDNDDDAVDCVGSDKDMDGIVKDDVGGQEI